MPHWICDECETAKDSDPACGPCLFAIKAKGAGQPIDCLWVHPFKGIISDLDRNRMVKWRAVSEEEFMRLVKETIEEFH